jgi:hypothetical protein
MRNGVAGESSIGRRFVRAGITTGVVDGLWAVVLTFAYQRSQIRLWQGIAATAFGQSMFDGGVPTVLLGLLMHFTVAFTWSAVFLLLVTRIPSLARALQSPSGAAAVAVVYGPMIWVVMSLIVIPLLTGNATPITVRWTIQLAGHAVFVGLPIVWSIRGSSATDRLVVA